MEKLYGELIVSITKKFRQLLKKFKSSSNKLDTSALSCAFQQNSTHVFTFSIKVAGVDRNSTKRKRFNLTAVTWQYIRCY